MHHGRDSSSSVNAPFLRSNRANEGPCSCKRDEIKDRSALECTSITSIHVSTALRLGPPILVRFCIIDCAPGLEYDLPMSYPEVRRPAVAGRFYSSNPEVLSRDLKGYTGTPSPSPGGPVNADIFVNALGCVVPHAGYIYSGHVAGAVYRRLPPRPCYIILGPNHFGRGAPLAIVSSGSWLTPLGEARIDSTMAHDLSESCHLISEDRVAHAGEHSLEVHLPFLQHTVGSFQFVPIAVGLGGYAALESLGGGIVKAVKRAQASVRPVMIIASSDMNHYEADAVTRLKDGKAIEAILALDPKGLYDVIRSEDISMCGYGPTVAMLTAARELGACRAELVKYATSAETSGDFDTVVGYAGIVIAS